MNALADLATSLSSRRVAVVGDVMLDHFMIGRVDRISPEAPVPVVRFERDDFRLGGAANVAHNIAALGATARLIGVVGDDEGAIQIAQEMRRASIRKATATPPEPPSRPWWRASKHWRPTPTRSCCPTTARA